MRNDSEQEINKASPAVVEEIVQRLNKQPGLVHMVGIGGIGMAGIALHLAGRGFQITGCDTATSSVTEWLGSHGIAVEQGQSDLHITDGMEWIVRTVAVSADHPEIVRAGKLGIPVYTRGMVLPALLCGQTSIAVSGTHGKTTTAALIAQMLYHGKMDPSFCIGGEVDVLGGVAGIGTDKIMVVEADESDGTIALYKPDFAVITNIEYDHMEYFKSEQSLVDCFKIFAGNAGRHVVYCADDARAALVCREFPNAISYGCSSRAYCSAAGIVEKPYSTQFDLLIEGASLGSVEIPVPGCHNVLNALAACVIALQMGMTFEKIKRALRYFMPVKRRFERIVDANNRLVILDYAHHPTEIKVTVQSALRQGYSRVFAVFQPHRYTRTLALGKDFPPAFEGLAEVVLTPVYEASEKSLPGGTSEDLLQHFKAFNRVPARSMPSLEDAWAYLKSIFKKGDLLLVIGAGDVDKIAYWAR